jgi:hypothetical protein
MTQENKQILQGLKQTNYGKALQELLDEKYTELNNVKSCLSWEDTLGRAHALKILDDIFSFMRDKVDVQNKTRYD